MGERVCVFVLKGERWSELERERERENVIKGRKRQRARVCVY